VALVVAQQLSLLANLFFAFLFGLLGYNIQQRFRAVLRPNERASPQYCTTFIRSELRTYTVPPSSLTDPPQYFVRCFLYRHQYVSFSIVRSPPHLT
jgi:hypothetical protein